MIQHIVMWKINENHEGKNKGELALELKNRLLELKHLIKEIKSMKVGINGAYMERNHDLVLVSQFNSFSDLEVYANHPEHIKVVEFVRQVTHSKVAVDYEI